MMTKAIFIRCRIKHIIIIKVFQKAVLRLMVISGFLKYKKNVCMATFVKYNIL